MGKYLYVASVNCKRGNVSDYKNLEFEADEKNFSPHLDTKDKNKVALRLAKNQNGGDVVGYDKVEIESYSINGILNGQHLSVIADFDKKGNLSIENAPRPSDPAIMDILNKLMAQ